MKLFKYDKQYDFKKIFKDKLKDRYKIKGIKFDYSKRDGRIVFNKRSQKEIIRKYYEDLSISDYNELKHKIFVREQKEKDLSKKELVSNKYSSNFNYTNIIKFMEKFLSEKEDESDTNIKNGKLNLEKFTRNIKKYKVNENLKNIVLNFGKPKEENKLFFSEKMAKEIKNKIQKKRRINSARNYSQSKNNTANSYFFNINEDKNRKIILMNNKKEMMNKSNFIGEVNKNINNNLKLSTFLLSNDTNENFKKNKSTSSILLPSNLINLENQKKMENNIRYDSINNNQKRSKYTYLNKKENSFQGENKNLKNKRLLMNSTNFTQYTNFSLYNKKDTNENKKNAEPSELLMEDCNSIRLMKFKNNYVQKKYLKSKNSFRQQSCSNIKNKNKNNFILSYNESSKKIKNILRNSSGFKNKSYLKVINKPIYTTNIGDLIFEYERIKKSTKKLKKNYREKHFSTYKEIDHLLEVKEDMLMFLLKQKFLNSKFRPKPIKITKDKKEFINKMKDYVEMLEEKPRNLYIVAKI